MNDRADWSGNETDESRWTSTDAPREADDHVRQIRRNATTLAADAQDAALDLERYVVDRMKRQPYATLSVAAAAGYVLGGGLASRFTLAMLGVATRVATALAIREVTERYQPFTPASGHDTSNPTASRKQPAPLQVSPPPASTNETTA